MYQEGVSDYLATIAVLHVQQINNIKVIFMKTKFVWFNIIN